jgi:hypothetical protein
MIEDFVLLKRIKAKLKTADQWLKKTAEGDSAYKDLGRWSRWRRNPDKRVGGFEVLETNIDLQSFALRIGAIKGNER